MERANDLFIQSRKIVKEVYWDLVRVVRVFQEQKGFKDSSPETLSTVNQMCEEIVDKIRFNMLDMPERTHNDLMECVREIQQYWIGGKPCSIWDITTYGKFAGDRDLADDEVVKDYVNELVVEFYDGIRDILKEYIVREEHLCATVVDRRRS